MIKNLSEKISKIKDTKIKDIKLLILLVMLINIFFVTQIYSAEKPLIIVTS